MKTNTSPKPVKKPKAPAARGSLDHIVGLVIAVDFDGTCVTHEYPKVGRFIGAERVLADLASAGAKLILWTMRSGKELQDAVDWFADRKIPLFGIQRNPTQDEWTTSPKAYAQIYIDDAALGAPLCAGLPGERPYIDWDRARDILLPNASHQRHLPAETDTENHNQHCSG